MNAPPRNFHHLPNHYLAWLAGKQDPMIRAIARFTPIQFAYRNKVINVYPFDLLVPICVTAKREDCDVDLLEERVKNYFHVVFGVERPYWPGRALFRMFLQDRILRYQQEIAKNQALLQKLDYEPTQDDVTEDEENELDKLL